MIDNPLSPEEFQQARDAFEGWAKDYGLTTQISPSWKDSENPYYSAETRFAFTAWVASRVNARPRSRLVGASGKAREFLDMLDAIDESNQR